VIDLVEGNLMCRVIGLQWKVLRRVAAGKGARIGGVLQASLVEIDRPAVRSSP